MKFGPRTPNLSKSFKARTTGKAKRKIKSTINPLYGKKGMGWVNNPKKAAYNKVYNKTSFDTLKPIKNINNGAQTNLKNYKPDIFQFYPYELINLHKYTINQYDWKNFSDSIIPENYYENLFLENPGFLSNIFPHWEKRKHNQAIEKDVKEKEQFEYKKSIYNNLISGPPENYMSFLNENLTKAGFEIFTSEFEFRLHDKQSIEIIFNFSDHRIPETYDFNGKIKKYNKTEYFQLFKYFLFSSILRLANEIFNIVPLDTISINVNYDDNLILKSYFNLELTDDIYDLDSLIEIEDYLIKNNAEFKYLKTKGFKSLV